MPLGTSHTEIGVLLREGGSLILQRDDGGRWRLDTDEAPETLLGLRVRIEAVRSGFDLLDVARIGRAE
jgi:hypothetical protein